MTNSISPPYPKDLQILHNNNFIDPINPIFNLKLDNLKKKTFNANELLTNQDIYLHNLNDVYYKNKINQANIKNINYVNERNMNEINIKENSNNTYKLFENVLNKTSFVYYKFFGFLQKLTDIFFTIINGNIGALILGIIAFILFFILILWLLGVINFDPNSNNNNEYDDFARSNELYSNKIIIDRRRTYPQSIDNNNIKFDFNQFKNNGVSYLLEYSRDSIQNSNSYKETQAFISKFTDSTANAVSSIRRTTEEEDIEKTPRIRINEADLNYRLHDTFYLPIDDFLIAIIHPLDFDYSKESDFEISNDYKSLISKITNFSFNDLSNIKIIFEKNNSIENNQFQIEKIISNNNKNIIFYHKNNNQNNNILLVNYNSDNTISIKFNITYFNYQSYLPKLNIKTQRT